MEPPLDVTSADIDPSPAASAPDEGSSLLFGAGSATPKARGTGCPGVERALDGW
jgi:hypothetical protein